MRLASIEGKGLRAFDAPFVLPLPERGLIQVRGPSGVGKTTLLTVPAFVLGYGPPATKLQSWFEGAPKLTGRIVLESSKHRVEVQRAGSLLVTIDGEEVEGGAKAQEEALAKVLPLPMDVIARLSHRRQRQRSAFLSLPDEKKKTVLAGPLGLDAMEAKLRSGLKRVAAARDVLARAEAGAEAADVAAQGAMVPDDLTALGEAAAAAGAAELAAREAERAAAAVETEVQRLASEGKKAFLADLDASIVAQATALAAAERALADEGHLPVADVVAAVAEAHDAVLALDEASQSRERALEAARARWRTDRARWDKSLTFARAAAARLPGLEQEVARLRHALGHLTGATCPTCRRDWPEGAAQERGQVEAALAAAAALAAEAVTQAGGVGPAEAWLAANPEPTDPQLALLAQAAPIVLRRHADARAALAAAEATLQAQRDTRLRDARAALATLRGQRLAADSIVDPAVAEARAKWELAYARFETAMATKKAAEDRLATARTVAEQWRVVQQRFRDALDARRAAEQAFNEEADTLEAVRAFVGKVFDEMLLEVADEVTALLADVPNVRHCVFSFRSDVVTKDGEVTRHAIVPVLTIDGHEVGLGELDGASGGMLSSVELAVDLGVLQVLERRLGATLGWLVVEEAFEGMGTVDREACMEILRRQTARRLVLVVDHMSETQGLVDQTITVAADNGHARIAA